jgi:hypothetical protein
VLVLVSGGSPLVDKHSVIHAAGLAGAAA